MLFSFEIKIDFKVLANNFTEYLLTATFKGFLVVSGQKLNMSKTRFKWYLYFWLIRISLEKH